MEIDFLKDENNYLSKKLDEQEDEILGLETERDVLKSEVKRLKAELKYYKEKSEIQEYNIKSAIKHCEESSKTIKSEYFSDVLWILKGEE